MGDDLRDYFEENLEGMVSDIRAIIEAESPSHDPALLKKCADVISAIGEKRLSVKPETISTDAGSPILVFRIGGEEGKPALLLTHYDTVHREGTLKDIPFSIKDGIMRGPGIFDMKTGIVQGIWAMKYLLENGGARRPVILMSTPDEEVGSSASRKHIEKFAAESEYVVVLEASAEGKIKTGRKGTGRFNILVKGRAAHAGLEPEKGINAIEEISRMVLQLQELNRNDKGTTVNVGTIRGGTTSNVVPAEAEIRIDIRVWSDSEAERIRKSVESLKPRHPEAKVEISGDFDRPPMQSTEKTDALVKVIKDMSSEMGYKLEDTAVGGASDGNLVAPLGIPVIDGFGAVGAGAHSVTEWASAKELPFRTALTVRTLQSL